MTQQKAIKELKRKINEAEELQEEFARYFAIFSTLIDALKRELYEKEKKEEKTKE